MFKLQNNTFGQLVSIIRISDNACIPFDPDNTDYQAYLKWLAEGNQPYPADYVEPSNELSVEPLPADEQGAA